MAATPRTKRDGSPANEAQGTTPAPGTPWWAMPLLLGLAFLSAAGFMSTAAVVIRQRRAPSPITVVPAARPVRTVHVDHSATPPTVVPVPEPVANAGVAPELPAPASDEAQPDPVESPETPQPEVAAAGPVSPPDAATVPREAPPTPSDIIARGRMLFDRHWSPNDPLCQGDGLGPVYNATSCLDCHRQGGPGGAGPSSTNAVLVTALGHAEPAGLTAQEEGLPYTLRPFRGNRIEEADQATLVKIDPGFADAPSIVLHRFGVENGYTRWRNKLSTALLQVPMERPGGSREPLLRFRVGVFGNLVLHMTQRNPSPLFGAGLIDRVTEETLAAIALNQPAEIRGRIARLESGDIGRFGWKAQVATLNDFVLSACANELGLEVPGHHQAASALARTSAQGLDLSEQDCNALVTYVRSLPAPTVVPSHDATDKNAEEGRRIFTAIGCAGCHMPSVGTLDGIYSDLLVHDMGESLSDPGSYYGGQGAGGSAGTTEWRTPPLWGVSASRPYLHDGRAATLDEAVFLHGGQGEASAQRFGALSPRQKAQVRAFLNTLAPPRPDRVMETGSLSQAGAESEKLAQRAENWLEMGESLERKGQTERALEFYREVLKSAPHAPAAKRATERIKSLTGTSAGGTAAEKPASSATPSAP